MHLRFFKCNCFWFWVLYCKISNCPNIFLNLLYDFAVIFYIEFSQPVCDATGCGEGPMRDQLVERVETGGGKELGGGRVHICRVVVSWLLPRRLWTAELGLNQGFGLNCIRHFSERTIINYYFIYKKFMNMFFKIIFIKVTFEICFNTSSSSWSMTDRWVHFHLYSTYNWLK